MAKQGKIICKIPTTKPDQNLEVEVYYTKGGNNAFGTGSTARGYYMGVMPVTEKRTSDGQATMREFTLFCGVKHLLQEAKAFSQSRLDSISSEYHQRHPLVAQLVRGILQHAAEKPHLYGKDGLQLANPTDIEEKQG